MIYLVEIEGYSSVTLAVETLRFCTGIGFITKPTEVPANTKYLPRVSQAGSLTANMFTGGATSGASTVGKGEIILRNIDGELDYLANWGFDGRKVVVRRGVETGAYPNDFPILYSATIKQPVPETSKFIFQLRDTRYTLDKPVQTLKFDGSNVLPNGLEGSSTDIKDKTKPMTIGKIWNASPLCVNTSKLIYALNIRQLGMFDSISDVDLLPDFDAALGSSIPLNSGISVLAAYDSGASLTAGANYTSEEEMNTQVPAGGTYRVYPEGGYIRLGLQPTGAFTVDCMDLLSVTVTPTVANLMKNLLIQEAKLPLANINNDDFTALNTANSNAVGYYITDETKFQAVFDSFCASVGAWYGFDRFDIFRIKQIALPLVAPTVYINKSSSYEMLSVSDTDNGVPARRLVMQWRKNYTVIKGTEVIGVTNDRKTQLEIEYRETEGKDDLVAEKHLLSDTMRVTSAFYDEPTAEVSRQFAIYKERHDKFRIRVSLNEANSEQLLTLGTVANVTLPRYNLQNGKNLMAIGYSLDCNNNYIDVIFWG